MQLAVCNNCHKMHNIKDIIAYKKEEKVAIKNCLHEEFPNNPIPSRRNQCNNLLTILKKSKRETIAVPCMLFSKPNIRQQLSMLCQRPDFENMLKLSGVQRKEVNIYSDIYDDLLFNLDWFQPFIYTQHSTGAIYASICNLPRSERNKPENIIYLGFLPDPKEVGLDCINHYLAPIVDELLELWRGWRIPKTYQYPNRLDIKVALIVGSSDIPATRKIFGHESAVMKYHRCEKRNIYSQEYKKTHYGGEHTYKISTAESHKRYAHEWLQCNSMEKLSMEQLQVAQKRIDHVELPFDIGRIPPKIAIRNNGFSNFNC
ncbi:unnamed protein product [Rhizophagus irregularis]|nr:unnamed protein product [Rhizophagus irregularis]